MFGHPRRQAQGQGQASVGVLSLRCINSRVHADGKEARGLGRTELSSHQLSLGMEVDKASSDPCIGGDTPSSSFGQRWLNDDSDGEGRNLDPSATSLKLFSMRSQDTEYSHTDNIVSLSGWCDGNAGRGKVLSSGCSDPSSVISSGRRAGEGVRAGRGWCRPAANGCACRAPLTTSCWPLLTRKRSCALTPAWR